MNMHQESTDEMVSYQQQRISQEFAAIQRSTFWRDVRIQVAHVLMRAGEALDRGCQEHMACVPAQTATAGLR